MRFIKIKRPLKGLAGLVGWHVGVYDQEKKGVYSGVNHNGNLTLQKENINQWNNWEQVDTSIPYSSEEIRQRIAIMRLKLNNPNEQTNFNYIKYDNKRRNCEHLANWILKNQWTSPQGKSLEIAEGLLFPVAITSISSGSSSSASGSPSSALGSSSSASGSSSSASSASNDPFNFYID